MTKEHVDHHEAGHFVAAYFMGTHERLTAVTIVPKGDAAGRNEGDGSDPLGDDCSEQEVRNLVVELFAGYAADVRFDPAREGDGGARAGAEDDDAKAKVRLGWISKHKREREKLEDYLRRLAAALVEEHWTAVTALARELLEHKTLEGYEAGWVVAIAEGEQAKGELAEYRRHRDALRGARAAKGRA
jgi:hypothetical protein